MIERDVEGTAKLSSFRRLRFTGEYDLIAHYVFPNPGMNGYLNLTFVAANGDSFTITGSSDIFGFGDFPPAAPWSIVAATGHFSHYSGSGSYTITGLDPNNTSDTTPLAISLDGTVTKES